MGRVTERNRFIGDCRRKGMDFREANAEWTAEHGGGVPHVSNPSGVGGEALAVALGIVGATVGLGLLAGVAQSYLLRAQYGHVDWARQLKGTGGLW